MLIIYHNNSQMTACEGFDGHQYLQKNLASLIYLLALKHADTFIVWCHEDLKDYCDLDYIKKNGKEREMWSYQIADSYLTADIGYVDESVFIAVNKKVKYPTWLMSGQIGVLSTNIIKQTNEKLWLQTESLDYVLLSVAKIYQPKGLFCYSNPFLLKTFPTKTKINQVSIFGLYNFVKSNYKWVWVFLLFINRLLDQKTFDIFPLLWCLGRRQTNIALGNDLNFKETSSNMYCGTEKIDVVIPTIGRKKYLLDVLNDINAQTHLPANVIIVEQNPDLNSTSELDYLSTEKWRFNIKHFFTHQTGACQARNLALKQIESEWVFLADDDIRFSNNLFSSTLSQLIKMKITAATMSCLRTGDKKIFRHIFQWGSFGSGCSFLKSSVLGPVFFDEAYEFGFGEDSDFGMLIRNLGHDIIYLPEPEILHLKAPMGGFRTKPSLAWLDEPIQPKPSPTVMLFQLSHKTKPQLQGFKLILFLKNYKLQPIKNPLTYFFKFQKQWEVSIKWAQHLRKKNDV
jgi:hypothetical protein